MNYTVHGILQARILEWGSLSLLQGIFPTQGWNPGLSLLIKLKEVEENPATEQSRISVGSDLKQNDMARKNLALQISKNRLSSLHKSSKNVVIRFLER